MKYLLFFIVAVSLAACGSDKKRKNNESASTEIESSHYPEGEKVYNTSCIACHQESGVGVEGAFPPLAQSDYLLADKFRAIEIAKNGMEGEIVVNGTTYNNMMAPQGLSHKEVKNVVNYILNTWGNNGGEVTDEDVIKVLGEE